MKYSEEVVRRKAVDEEGRRCEILERITYGRAEQPDGSLGQPEVITRRFDLQTGDSVIHLGGDEYLNDVSGLKLKVT